MPTTAANFPIPPGTPPAYPLPIIHSASARAVTVDTSLGPRQATEVTLRGENFLIRAADPDVTVNGHALVRFRIDDDQSGLVGYFFGILAGPSADVVVDYGAGVRGRWTGQLPGTSGTAKLRWLLLLALLLMLLGALLVVLGFPGPGVFLVLVAAALVLVVVLQS